MDMDKFFKTDVLDVSVDINGETNIYKVRMSFIGTLDELHDFIKKNNVEQIDRKMILKALMYSSLNLEAFLPLYPITKNVKPSFVMT